jgi:hypothetical protein
MSELKSPGVPLSVGYTEYYPSMYNKNSKGIYVASRASIPERSAMWREYRLHGYDIISTWIDEAGEGETQSYEDLWSRIVREIYDCEYFILYAEESDFPLKGALIEAGMALGLGRNVIVVLPFEPEGVTLRPIGSWIKLPSVMVVKTVQDALDIAIGVVDPWKNIEPIIIDTPNFPPNEMDEIFAWAKNLAGDSIKAGESEYGPDYKA